MAESFAGSGGAGALAGKRAASLPPASGGLVRRASPPGLVVVLVLAAVFSIAVGSVDVPLGTVAGILAWKLPVLGDWVVPAPWWTPAQEAIVVQVRLPRAALAGVVGAGLAIAGAAYQGLFRNPLADPYLMGTAQGAAAGAVLALVVPLPAVVYRWGGVQLSAFLGASLTVAVVYRLASYRRGTSTGTLILAGVAMGSLASALTTFLMFHHGDRLVTVYGWLLGGFSVATWSAVSFAFLAIAAGAGVLLLGARPLNALQLGEEQAGYLGVPVGQVRLALVTAATLATAAAVSVSGVIGFVGIIIPHAVRLVWGGDYRRLLPYSLVLGASFLLVSDAVARRAIAPTELPIGVVTALCGVPFFLTLLRRRQVREL